MRALILIALLALSACAFSSDRPFFVKADAAFPLAIGARLEWHDRPDGESFVMQVARDEGGYVFRDEAKPDEPLRNVLFIPITDTPEEDYIVQVRLRADDEATAYGFLWRTAEGYRAITSPSAFESDDAHTAMLTRLCAARGYGACHVRSARDLRAIYRRIVRPLFVTGAAVPDSYVDLVPASP